MRRCDALSLALSDALDQRRRVLGLTQTALGARMGRSQSTVSQMLDGCLIRTTAYAKAAESLGCDLVITVRPRV